MNITYGHELNAKPWSALKVLKRTTNTPIK